MNKKKATLIGTSDAIESRQIKYNGVEKSKEMMSRHLIIIFFSLLNYIVSKYNNIVTYQYKKWPILREKKPNLDTEKKQKWNISRQKKKKIFGFSKHKKARELMRMMFMVMLFFQLCLTVLVYGILLFHHIFSIIILQIDPNRSK